MSTRQATGAGSGGPGSFGLKLGGLHATMHWLAVQVRERLTCLPGGKLLAIGLVVTLISCVLEVANINNSWLLFEDFQLPFAPAVGALALAISIWRGEKANVGFRLSIALSLAATGTGQLLRDLPDVVGPAAPSWLGLAADALNFVGVALGVRALARSIGHRLSGETRTIILIDGMIMVFSGTAVALAGWLAKEGAAGSSGANIAAGLVVPIVAGIFLASAGAAVMAALAIRVAPRIEGVWVVALGMIMLWLSWMGWVARFATGAPDSIEPMDSIFAIGALVTTYGAMTWRLKPGGGMRYERIAHRVSDWLPVAAVVACAAVDITPHHGLFGTDPVAVCTGIVILFAIARNRVMQGRERTASERFTNSMIERAAATVAMSRLETAATAEETARGICAGALDIAGIDASTIYAFGPSGAVVVGALGVGSNLLEIGSVVSGERGRDLRSHADLGLWLESWTDRVPENGHDRALVEAGLRAEALAPMMYNDEVIGVMTIGAVSIAHARALGDRLTTLTEFCVMGGSLLGPLLAERWHRDSLIAEVQAVIDDSAFIPVFQPIVELSSGENVGYEALTRFRDGTRPDLRFLAADKVGMMVSLEEATLIRQVAGAHQLPVGSFLSLNVSPALVLTPGVIDAILDKADRPVVLEVTEHVEIDDYARLLELLAAARQRARLSVDDAGAGYAGLRHILELRPEFVKLDISLVRGIDTDPARQAMVAGMAHFAGEVGCELIAEGIETAGEMAAVIALGVRYGQGYLLCRPATVDTFAEPTSVAQPPSAQAA